MFASEAGGVFGSDGVDWMKTFGVYLLPSIALTAIVLRHADPLPASDSATSVKKAGSGTGPGSHAGAGRDTESRESPMWLPPSGGSERQP
jgi:hypothetical protein